MRLSLIDQQKSFRIDFRKKKLSVRSSDFTDGGFGNGLEADIRLPDSSPIATTVGLQHLEKLNHLQPAQEMIQKAISYLESSFEKIKERTPCC